MYELDGLKEGPIFLGEATAEDWVDKAFPVIQKRIDKYENITWILADSTCYRHSKTEIRFNLMAIIKNRQTMFKESVNNLQQKREKVQQRMAQLQNTEKSMLLEHYCLFVPTLVLRCYGRRYRLTFNN